MNISNNILFNFSDIHLHPEFLQEYMIEASAQDVKFYILAYSMSKSENYEINIMDIARLFKVGLAVIFESFEYWKKLGLVDIMEVKNRNYKVIHSFDYLQDYDDIRLIFKNMENDRMINQEDDFDTEYEIDHIVKNQSSSQKEQFVSTTQMLKEASNDVNGYEFSNFIARLEHLRKGKTLSYEAKRRLLYYRIKLGLSIDLIEFACNMSYENPYVKEYNHLNYARGILNNFYEANIFTLEDYYNSQKNSNYKLPTPEEIQSKRVYSSNTNSSKPVNKRKNFPFSSTKSSTYTCEKSQKEHSEDKISDYPINKIISKQESERQRMREKLKKNKSTHREKSDI